VPSVIRLGALALALSVSPVSPLLLVLIPLGLMLVALRPDTDNTSGLLTGLVLLGLAFASVLASPGPDWFAQRAWAVLLGGGFILATLAMRNADLLGRSFGAVAIGAVAVAVAGLLRPEVVTSLDSWMSDRIHVASVVLLQWVTTVDVEPDVAASVSAAIVGWSEVQKQIYPALLALASLPALAIAWYFLGRLTGRPEVPAPLRRFRFSEHFVWMFAIGLALYALPLGEAAARIGGNAALFMVVLYVVRGGAIAIWILGAAGASAFTWVLFVIAAALLYPVAIGALFAAGMGDTWFDVRERSWRFIPPSADDR
jgi:hypothetical protein